MKKVALSMALLAGFNVAWAQTDASSFAGVSSSGDWEPAKPFVAGKSSEPLPLNSLMADQVKGNSFAMSAAIPPIRASEIQKEASQLGSQSGMVRRLRDYELSLKKQINFLDRSYDFSKLALSVPMDATKPATNPDPRSGNGEYAMVLPAVLLEGHDADSFPNDDEMRIADRTYKLHAKERLVPVDKKTGRPVVPTWRDYLIISFDEVKMPYESLLPKNDAEKALWNYWVQKGWAMGKEQADAIYQDRWATLNRDFIGMLNVRQANSEGRLSKPKVAGLNMGVTGGGSEMRVNDRVLKIVDHSALVADPKKWRASPEKD